MSHSSSDYCKRPATLCVLHYLLVASLLCVLAGWPGRADAQTTTQKDQQMAQQIDDALTAAFPTDGPGAAVIVVRDGAVILRKGYGLANLELGVPIQPEMVFRLASVTKQFTAMAILMLSEEGKLALTDDITKYLPGYPTHGQTITIEHLLTHTGGVKDLESLPARLAVARNDLSLAEVIALFQDEPLDFAPGEAWSYSNSGYVLLGAIIEQISGLSYAEFIQQHIFIPLGMTHSYYDDTIHLIPGRVVGYSRGADGYANAAYMSMTHPHAAGALGCRPLYGQAGQTGDVAAGVQALCPQERPIHRLWLRVGHRQLRRTSHCRAQRRDQRLSHPGDASAGGQSLRCHPDQHGQPAG